MATLALAKIPTTPVPSVQILVDGITSDSLVEVSRNPAGAVPAGIVRGTPREVEAGGVVLIYDVEFPFGVELEYTAVIRDATSGSVVETLKTSISAVDAVGALVISDITRDSVVVPTWIDQRDYRTDFGGSRIAIAGKRNPLYLLSVRSSWGSTISILTETPTQDEEVDEITSRGSVLLFRRLNEECYLQDGFLVIEDASKQRLGTSAKGTKRVWEFRVQEVDPLPASIEAQVVTLEDMHEYEPTTLETLSTRASTLLDLSLAVANAL